MSNMFVTNFVTYHCDKRTPFSSSIYWFCWCTVQVVSHIVLGCGMAIVTKNQCYKLHMLCGHWVLPLVHSS